MARHQAVQKLTGAGLAPWQIELALRALLRDLCADFPVTRLAALCGLSRSYFARAFKVSMGVSPHRWLVRQRVRRAGELLERTNDSISVIATTCGFADQSHLTRAFHAIVGTTPAAWRRQCKAGVVRSLSPAAAARS